ncbi:tripartite tricarboxylate transporter substrate binding protein [Comamonas terrigena]|jgi:tripartite-type tricarboxylate transporter receptor subunit TctC|uniref:Bug family tripartite tricarboxylate transporter substrate binding protein n=1 Tax=Comamonas terrigena TaxID=32013 RepID=UPI00244C32B2|nr:tripartite tricarboxylate transporter substrate binding protein [Comamonas terrigena]MDH1289836.1 tripartite tricarboxylate transporter substrate binding protein [Comamonas terrigena]
MDRRQWLAGTAAVAAGGLWGTRALAQTAAPGLAGWPRQSIRWLVPYPPGGGTDVLARTVAEAMRPALGQPIVIENKPGASTNIAAHQVATARADGYTLMSADNAVLAFNEHLFRKLPFEPARDFSYIGGISRFPLVLVVNPAFPVQTVAQLLERAQAQPGGIHYASPGNGSPHHLAMELFKQRTGAQLTHVPYKGAAPAVADVMGGQVPCMFLDLAAGLPLMQTGKVRPLASGSAQRLAALPQVPTLAEAGVSGAEVYAFQGVLGPAGIPTAVVERLNAELNRALASPAVALRLKELGMDALAGSPTQFYTQAREEARRWGEIIQRASVQLD